MSAQQTEADRRRTPLRRLDAVFGGPLWWAAHLGSMYWLVPRTCEWGTTWPLHVATVVFAALCGRAALSAVQIMRGGRLVVDRESGRRDVYLGWLGLALAILFGVTVVLEWVPTLIVGPCL